MVSHAHRPLLTTHYLLLPPPSQSGATTINLPDTVGYTLPDEYASIFAYCIANTKDAHKVS